MKRTWPIALYLPYLPTVLTSTCYWPNGVEVDNIPCSSGGNHTACCGSGYACLSNGLCQVTEHALSVNFTKDIPWLVRGSCTDNTWSDPACPRVCLTGKGTHGPYEISKCLNGAQDQYFCYDWPTETSNMNIDRCFRSEDLFQLDANPTTQTVVGIQASSTSTVPSSSSTIAKTALNTPTTMPSMPSTTQKPDYSTAIGASVGGTLGVIALGALIYVWARHRYFRTRPSSGKQIDTRPQVHELPLEGDARELSTNFNSHELLTEREHRIRGS